MILEMWFHSWGKVGVGGVLCKQEEKEGLHQLKSRHGARDLELGGRGENVTRGREGDLTHAVMHTGVPRLCWVLGKQRQD